MPSFNGFDFGGFSNASRLFSPDVMNKAQQSYNTGISQFKPFTPKEKPVEQPPQEDQGMFPGQLSIMGGGFNPYSKGSWEDDLLRQLGVQLMGDVALIPKNIDLSNVDARTVLSGFLGGGGFKDASDTKSGLKRYYDAGGK